MRDPIHVLHVDDDPDFLELTSSFLERVADEFELTAALSAPKALSRLQDADVDCVVSDFQMPEMDGLELLREVRNDEPRLPFILFTGKGSETIASDAISAGVTDYLRKGGRTETYELLANRIRNAVGQYRNALDLERAHDWFKVLLEESSDAIFVVGPDGVFEWVSPVAESLLGYSADELVGQNGFNHVHTADVENAQALFAELAANPGDRVSTHLRLRHQDGSEVRVESRGRNLLDHPLIGGIVVYMCEVAPMEEPPAPSP